MDPESSFELMERAQSGDSSALDKLLARYRPRLQRWASGRLPRYARDMTDTDDLVQDAMLGTFKNMPAFEQRGEWALQAYLRRAVTNEGNLEPFELCREGRYQWALQSEDGLLISLQRYQAALAKNPRYAPAYSGLADTYMSMRQFGLMPYPEALGKAGAAAKKAVELDSSLAEAHASLGRVQTDRFEWGAAEASLRSAIALKDDYAPAHHWYSILLSQNGRFSEAISEAKVAISHDPLSTVTSAQLANVLLLARRFDEAIAQCEKLLQMDPAFAGGHQMIGTAYSYKREYERALQAFQRAAQLAPVGREDTEELADIGLVLRKMGKAADADRLMTDLLERARQGYRRVAPGLAAIYGVLGKGDDAFRWLGRAAEVRDPAIGYLKVDPRWDSLRSDRRFNDLLNQMGFDRDR